MAGYFIYSLDWKKSNAFASNPRDQWVLAFATPFSDSLDQWVDEMEEEDPMADWPAEPDQLVPHLHELLQRDDWYEGLTDTGKEVLERAVQDFCEGENGNHLGFRVDGNDSIGWDVIELAKNHHNIGGTEITKRIVSRFGTCPLQYTPPNRASGDAWGWRPSHSMHPPEEVKQLLAELREAQEVIVSSNKDHVQDDYEELVSVLDRIIRDERTLYVSVDT